LEKRGQNLNVEEGIYGDELALFQFSATAKKENLEQITLGQVVVFGPDAYIISYTCNPFVVGQDQFESVFKRFLNSFNLIDKEGNCVLGPNAKGREEALKA
jgi:hypothetical protein